MKGKSIIGEHYGMLTVHDEYTNEKGCRVCLCECACGNTKVVQKSNLTGGRTKSCGCMEEKNRKRYVDIAGHKFGRLTALRPTDERKDGNIVWECICECGSIALVAGRNLTRGDTRSCGCILKEKSDITDRRFGKLTALYPAEKQTDSRQKWVCLCDCGNTSSVSISNLKNGHTKSCGCLQTEEKRTLIEGTCLEVIASEKVPKNNISGVRGVSYHSKTDSWVATINFKNKHYYLGKFEKLTDAAAARQRAEEEHFEPILDKYRHLLRKTVS